MWTRFGIQHFVLCREVVFFQRLFCTEFVYNGTFGLLEVCPLSECPLSEVSLYMRKFAWKMSLTLQPVINWCQFCSTAVQCLPHVAIYMYVIYAGAQG